MSALLNQNLNRLCYELISLDQSVPEEKAKYESIVKQFVQEVDMAIAIDKFSDSQVEMLKREIDFLDAQVKKYEAIQRNLRYVAANVMKELGVKKLETENGHRMTIGESFAVVVTDEDALPSWAKEERKEVHVKKTEIKDAIRNGVNVPGAELKRNVSVSFR